MVNQTFYQKRLIYTFLALMGLLCWNRAFAQTPRQISGTVADASNQQLLPGVSVVIKGSQNGTSTGTDGQFSLSAVSGDVLVFSFIGFASAEVVIANQTTIEVELQPDTQALDELVVVGYSSQRKKDITGSVSVVDMKAVKAVPAGSAMQALQGQAAGVNVISSGVPGAGSNIFVRGISSFGDTQPLVLIDGIQGDLNNISAEDIESFQVLKDAGAAAIYGVRGSNGVIIVTTKKGKTGQPSITYDGYVGVQLPLAGNPFNLLNTNDFAKVVLTADPNNAIFRNGIPDYLYAGPGAAGIAMEGDPAVDPSLYSLNPISTASNYLIQKVNKQGTNWFQEVFNPAVTTNHNITASGATSRASYMFSLGYINQQGTLLNTYLKRYSARINTTYNITDKFRVGENMNFYYRDSPGFGNQSEFGVLSQVYRMMPIVPVRDIMGNYGGTFAGPSLGSNGNAVASQERRINNRSHSWNTIGNVYAELDFLKDFTFRTSFGGSISNGYGQSFGFTPYENKEGNSNPNSYSESASYGNMVMWTNTLNYRKYIEKHSVQVLAGTEYIRSNGRSVGGGSQGFFSTDYNYLILGNGTTGVTNYSSAYENRLYSVFGRVDYAYNDRYLLGLTVRRDGSSRFGDQKRFGVFPSFSLGWRMSEEAFLRDVNWLDDLKLKGSYGILGSQNNVSPENAFSLYGGGYGNAYYDIAGTSNSVQQGFIQTRIGNPLAGWEENIVSNVGVESVLFNNSLSVSLEYYKKSINGLLFSQPLPATVGGATAPVVNIGDIQNKGWDVAVNYRAALAKDLELNIGANITTYKNKVVSIPDPGYFDVASLQGMGTIVRNQVGQATSSFFGYDVIGLFNSEADVTGSPAQTGAAPGRFKYRDVNNDGVITPDDRTFLGSPNPDFTYGINIGLNYKRFDFSTILYGSQGNEIVNTTRSYTHFYGGYIGNKSNELLNAWSPQNTDTNIPVIEAGTSLSTSGTMNSFFMEDGSYLRMRSLMIGYTFNPAVLQKIKMSKLRIYVQAANLFTLTQYSGLDPELNGSSQAYGIDFGNYPNNQKNFLLGLNLTF